jgi:hypothetical protein
LVATPLWHLECAIAERGAGRVGRDILGSRPSSTARRCESQSQRSNVAAIASLRGPSLRGMSPWSLHPPTHFILFLTGLPFYVPYPTLQDWEQFRGTGHIYSEFEINSPYHGNLSTHENFYSALSLSLNARRALSRTSPFSEA